MAKRARENEANMVKRKTEIGQSKNRAVKHTAPQARGTKKQPTQKRQVKKAPKKKDTGKIIKWTCLILLIIGAIVFLLTTPMFNVTKIDVSGNEQVSSEEIQSLSRIKLNENTFKNFKPTIVKNVKENAYIESATVKRKLPDTIKIEVKERTVKFMTKLSNNSYAYISSQGYILENSEQTKDVPTLKGLSTPEEELVPGNRLNVEDLEKLEVVLEIIRCCEENDIDNLIKTINIQDKNNYMISFKKENKTAHLGDGSNLSTKMLYVKAIMEAEGKNAGDIFVNGDLNNGFRPYFRNQI